MQASSGYCPSCNERLHDAVKYCPYCGAILHIPVQTESTEAASVKTPSAKKTTDDLLPKSKQSSPPPTPTPTPPLPKSASSSPKVTKPEEFHYSELSSNLSDVHPDSSKTLSKPFSLWKSLSLGIFGIFMLGMSVYVYRFFQPTEAEITCDDTLKQAVAMLAAGDAAGAKNQTVLSMASCSGEARVKASEVQAAADKILALQAGCERSFRRIDTFIAELRLKSAHEALDQIDIGCTDDLRSKSVLVKIEAGMLAATTAASDIRKHMDNGDFDAARTALDVLMNTNREFSNLDDIRKEIEAREKLLETPPLPVAPVQPPVQQETARLNKPTVSNTIAIQRDNQSQGALNRDASQTSSNSSPVTNSQAQQIQNRQTEMAQSLLRDAEIALSQFKFDAAKTYVESARKIDPGNIDAATMARRIKERELKYLSDETTIR